MERRTKSKRPATMAGRVGVLEAQVERLVGIAEAQIAVSRELAAGQKQLLAILRKLMPDADKGMIASMLQALSALMRGLPRG